MRAIDALVTVATFSALVAMLVWAGITIPTRATALEAELQTQAERALDLRGHRWARVRMQGQAAFVIGTAPDAAAELTAIEAVRTSSGSGGYLLGGVTRVRRIDTPAETGDETGLLGRITPTFSRDKAA